MLPEFVTQDQLCKRKNFLLVGYSYLILDSIRLLKSVFFLSPFKIDVMEKVVVIMSSPEFTEKEYNQVWDELKAAGHAHPKGLISHVGFKKPEGGFMVVDAWESADAFNEFGKALIPIIGKTGLPVPQPQIYKATYVYEPESVPA